MDRLFTWPWILGIAIAFLGVILVRLVSVQVTAPYQIWVRPPRVPVLRHWDLW